MTRGNVRLLYILLLAATAGSVAVFGFLPVSALFFALAVLMGITQGPLSAMLDSMAVKALQEHSNRIGQARLWGSLSFAIVVLVMGTVFDRNNAAIFPAFVLTSCLAIAVSLSMPAQDSSLRQPDFRLGSIRQAVSRPLFSSVPPFCCRWEFDRYAFPQLGPGRAGASSALVGYAWGGTALVEIPVFAITAKLLRRHRPEQLLITAGLINTLRMFLFAFTPNPWLLVFIHAIEGLAFPLITVGLVLLIDELVKPEFKTTGFTLQAACSHTLPRFLGSVWGGRIMDLFGGTGLFLVGAAITALGTAAMGLWWTKFRDRPKAHTAVSS